MKKKFEKITVYLLFILTLIFLFQKTTLFFVRKGNGFGTDVLNFYEQEKNSIDILVLGSSHAYSAINPYLIEELTGLKTYNFCTQQQPIWITYHYFIEALKTQNPQYVLLELFMVIDEEDDYAEESVNRDAIDKMKMSLNKIETIMASVDKKEDRTPYYFNIMKYHTRYKELNATDFKTAFLGETLDNKGYIALPKTEYAFPAQKLRSEEEAEIHNKSLKYLSRIFELAEENNMKLILIKTPALYDEQSLARLNTIKRIAKNKNIILLDYVNNMEKLNLDYYNDFYDHGHLSGTGSDKFTKKLIEDLNLN